MNFLETVLSKIARRYQLRGTLSGTMKLGRNLGHVEMTELGNFFGLAPLRVNKKEEIRLHFSLLLQNGTEAQWLDKIGQALGYPLVQEKREKESNAEFVRKILASLSLAFPDLEELFAILQEDSGGVEAMFHGSREDEVRRKCFQLAETVQFLLHNSTILTVSDLGARFFHNSKSLRQGLLRNLLLQWLALCSPELDGVGEEILLGRYHVVHDRLTVNAILYGPIIYEKNNKRYDWIKQLYLAGEAATIGWSNLQGMDRIYLSENGNSPPDLITCENEAPFSRLMQQNTNSCVLFTKGFPGSAVQRLYQLLAPQASICRHWGDSDPAGLRIAALLHGLYPLQLYRCDLASLKRCRDVLLPLTQRQKDICRHILNSCYDFPFQEELLFSHENGWLEQEGWYEEKNGS